MTTNINTEFKKLTRASTPFMERIAEFSISNNGFSKDASLTLITISNFQMIALIFRVAIERFQNLDSFTSQIARFPTNILTLDPLIDFSRNSSWPLIIVAIIWLYFLNFVIAMLSVIAKAKRGSSVRTSKSTKLWRSLLTLHLYVFVSPINNICLRIIKQHVSDDGLVTGLGQGIDIFVLGSSIVLLLFNWVFPIIKINVFTSYMFKPDPLATKNSWIEQLDFFQKAFVPLIFYFSLNLSGELLGDVPYWIIIIVNLLVSLGRDIAIFVTFPRYDVDAQFLNTSLSALVSLVSLLSIFISGFDLFFDQNGTQNLAFAFLFTAPMVLKLTYVQIEHEIYNILFEPLEKLNPEKLIHKFILVHYCKENKKLPNRHMKKLDELYYFYLVCEKERGRIFSEEDSDLLNSDFDQKETYYSIKRNFLERASKHYADCNIFKLYLANFFADNLKIWSQAVMTLKRIQNPGLKTRISINLIKQNLQSKIIDYCYNEPTGVNLYEYIQKQNSYDDLKSKLKKVISLQQAFWKEYNNNIVNLAKLDQLNKKIYNQKVQVQNDWSKLKKKIGDEYNKPYLLYAYYLRYADNQFYQAQSLFEEYTKNDLKHKGSKKGDFPTKDNLYDEKAMHLTIVINEEKPGIMVDASESFYRTMGYDKSFIIGYNINSILNSYIADLHDGFLLKFFRDGHTKIVDNVTKGIFMKNHSGFLTRVSTLVKINPFINNRGIYVTGLVRPIEDAKDFMVITPQGMVDGMSENIAKLLNIENYYGNIANICREFEVVHKAFNTIIEREIANSRQVKNKKSLNIEEKLELEVQRILYSQPLSSASSPSPTGRQSIRKRFSSKSSGESMLLSEEECLQIYTTYKYRGEILEFKQRQRQNHNIINLPESKERKMTQDSEKALKNNSDRDSLKSPVSDQSAATIVTLPFYCRVVPFIFSNGGYITIIEFESHAINSETPFIKEGKPKIKNSSQSGGSLSPVSGGQKINEDELDTPFEHEKKQGEKLLPPSMLLQHPPSSQYRNLGVNSQATSATFGGTSNFLPSIHMEGKAKNIRDIFYEEENFYTLNQEVDDTPIQVPQFLDKSNNISFLDANNASTSAFPLRHNNSQAYAERTRNFLEEHQTPRLEISEDRYRDRTGLDLTARRIETFNGNGGENFDNQEPEELTPGDNSDVLNFGTPMQSNNATMNHPVAFDLTSRSNDISAQMNPETTNRALIAKQEEKKELEKASNKTIVATASLDRKRKIEINKNQNQQHQDGSSINTGSRSFKQVYERVVEALETPFYSLVVDGVLLLLAIGIAINFIFYITGESLYLQNLTSLDKLKEVLTTADERLESLVYMNRGLRVTYTTQVGLAGDVNSPPIMNLIQTFLSDAFEWSYYTKERNDYLRNSLSEIEPFLREDFINNDLRIFDINDDLTNGSFINLTQFQAIDQIIGKMGALEEQFVNGDDLNLVVLNFNMRNSVNDLLIDCERSVGTLVDNYKINIQDTMKSFMIWTGLLLGGMAVMSTGLLVFIFYVIRKDLQFYNIFLKVSDTHLDQINQDLENCAMVINDESLDEMVDTMYQQKQYRKIGGNDRKYKFSRQIFSKALKKRYFNLYFLTTGIVVASMIIVVINFTFHRSDLNVLESKTERLNFGWQAQYNVSLAISSFVELIFNNDSTYVRDTAISEEVQQLQETLLNIPGRLTSEFQDDGKIDETVEPILFDDACLFIESEVLCQNAVKGSNKTTLINLLNELHSVQENGIEIFNAKTDRTFEDLQELTQMVFEQVGPLGLPIRELLGEMISRLENDYNEKLSSSRTYAIAILACVLAAFIINSSIYLYFLRTRIRRNIVWAKRMLRLIPINIILSNTLLKSYLLQNSSNILNSIKSRLF